MRILVYGAGVQGCQLAHSLAQNKKNVVTLLARGEWKEVIDQKGLTIRHMLQRKTTVVFKRKKTFANKSFTERITTSNNRAFFITMYFDLWILLQRKTLLYTKSNVLLFFSS